MGEDRLVHQRKQGGGASRAAVGGGAAHVGSRSIRLFRGVCCLSGARSGPPPRFGWRGAATNARPRAQPRARASASVWRRRAGQQEPATAPRQRRLARAATFRPPPPPQATADLLPQQVRPAVLHCRSFCSRDTHPCPRAGGAQRRQEVPTSLADPLGSHAARAGSQRQQALARAATLLNMRPRQASAPRWQQGAVAAGDTPAAAAAPRGAPSRSVQSQHAPAPAAARMSGQAASSRGQQAAQECHEQQAPPPAGPADPAASTHSSAGDAEVAAVPMPGKRRDAQQQQQPDIVQRRPSPPGYFVDARTRLQQLAAGTGGGR